MLTRKLAPYAMAMGLFAFGGTANATVVGPFEIEPCCSEASELEFLLNNEDIMAFVDDELESTIMSFGRLNIGDSNPDIVLSDQQTNEEGELVTADVSVLNIPSGFELLGVLVKDGTLFGGTDDAIMNAGTFWFADMLDDVGIVSSIDEFGNITYSGKGISHITAFKIASVVPLPGALVFMLTGIAGLGFIARRRQRSTV